MANKMTAVFFITMCLTVSMQTKTAAEDINKDAKDAPIQKTITAPPELPLASALVMLPDHEVWYSSFSTVSEDFELTRIRNHNLMVAHMRMMPSLLTMLCK